MLISEVKGWHFIISWDNPVPADSKKLRKELAKLGKVTDIATKTSVALAPKSNITYVHVRRTVARNLHSRDGKAFYVNLKTGKAMQISAKTKWRWVLAT